MEKEILFPELNNPDLAYETGVHIGDGCLSFSKSKNLYAVYYSGNSETDLKFFSVIIPNLIETLYGIKSHIELVSGEKSIRVRIYSKKLFNFKKEILGLPVGSKSGMSSLPTKIITKNISHIIAGVFDTDGCFKTVKKENKLYPRVTIRNKSKILSDIQKFLISQGIPCNIDRDRKTLVYCLSINGNMNVDKFFQVVKSRNPKNLDKYKAWVRNRSYNDGLVA